MATNREIAEAKKQAKIDQQYDGYPKWPTCINCVHRKVKSQEHKSWGFVHTEVTFVCAIGKFEVSLSATCEQHEFAKQEQI